MQDKTRRCASSSFAGLIMILSGAEAGPPLSIDDPGILDPGQLEFILAGAFEDSDESLDYELPIADISYGLTPNVQLSVTASRAVTDPDPGEAKSDFGPGSVGVKWRFWNQGGLEVSVAPFFETLLRDGAADRDVIEDIDAWTIPVQAQYSFASWRLNAEVGYSAIADSDDEWAYGVAATRPVSDDLELMAEIHGGVLKDLHDHGMLYRLGLDWAARDEFHVLFSVGSSVHQSGAEDLDLQGYLGLQWFR